MGPDGEVGGALIAVAVAWVADQQDAFDPGERDISIEALQAGCVDCFNLGSGPVKMPDLAHIADACRPAYEALRVHCR